MKSIASSKLNFATKLLFVVLSISVFVSIFFPQLFPFSQKEAAEWVKDQTYDRVIFISIQIVQVIIPPISHYFTSMLGGYIYGPIEGGILNFIGRVIGQILAFALAYKVSGFVIEKKGASLEQFRNLVAGEKKNLNLRALIIFAMVALPFFPDDELSYAMGFARFPIPLFFAVTLFGHVLGSFALAYLGSGEEFQGPLFMTLAAVTIMCFIALSWASIKYRDIKNKSKKS